ncbi:MAG: squalene/phytoene synthase family protein, partial [Microgenomates group bacterium]
AKILDLPKKSYQSAKKLGQSLQIINNIRDIFEDFQRGKIYIPEELLNKYQLNHKNFIDKKNREKLYQVIKELLLKAKNLQEQAKKDFKLFNKKKLLPIKIACDLYNLIGRKIAKKPELVFSGKKLKPNFFEIISVIVKNFLLIYVFNKKN